LKVMMNPRVHLLVVVNQKTLMIMTVNWILLMSCKVVKRRLVQAS